MNVVVALPFFSPLTGVVRAACAEKKRLMKVVVALPFFFPSYQRNKGRMWRRRGL
jgi:hypothetical protein